MDKRVYLGIDPGRTIGYALITLEDGKINPELSKVGQELTDDWQSRNTVPLSLVESCDVLIIEDFVGGGIRSKESSFVLKMIGEFRIVGQRQDKEVIEQAPRLRTKFLKRAKDSKMFKGRHGVDALAHVFRRIEEEGFDLWSTI